MGLYLTLVALGACSGRFAKTIVAQRNAAQKWSSWESFGVKNGVVTSRGTPVHVLTSLVLPVVTGFFQVRRLGREEETT